MPRGYHTMRDQARADADYQTALTDKAERLAWELVDLIGRDDYDAWVNAQPPWKSWAEFCEAVVSKLAELMQTSATAGDRAEEQQKGTY